MFGGLDNLSTYIENADDADSNVSMASSHADMMHSAEITTTKMSRCAIDTMKSWTTAYPPNVKPMCLHAAYLKIIHPVTGEVCEWDASATF